MERFVNTIIYKKTISFQDIFVRMDAEQKKLVRNMSDKEFDVFITKNLRNIEAGIDAGAEWDTILSVLPFGLEF